MKTRATTILAALAALTSTYATNISSEINWGQDSDTGFELTIIGTGLDYVDTFTSPSGLWSISAGVTGHYYQTDYMPEGEIEIAHLVRATYLPGVDFATRLTTTCSDWSGLLLRQRGVRAGKFGAKSGLVGIYSANHHLSSRTFLTIRPGSGR